MTTAKTVLMRITDVEQEYGINRRKLGRLTEEGRIKPYDGDLAGRYSKYYRVDVERLARELEEEKKEKKDSTNE